MAYLNPDDFRKSLERFDAWWHRSIIDRPVLTMPGVRTKPASPMPGRSHTSPRERWMDVEYAIDTFEKSLDGAAFVGDTFPMFNPNLGPHLTATPFGAQLQFDDSTSWSDPTIASAAQVLGMQANLDNPYWNTVRRMIDRSLERGQGRWITGLTDLHCNADIVATLRGPEGLCEDMGEDIDTAAAAVAHVSSFFPQMYDDLYKRLAAAGQPATMWLPCLHPGRMYVTNCDFICMISEAMFERAVLPSLRREMRFLERNIFHLDGPGALRHLDALLELPELDAVQWVFGAGNGPPTRWLDVYRRVQDAGKAVYVGCYNFDEVRQIMQALRPEGLWLRVFGDYTVDEAQGLVRELERWAAGLKV